MKWWEVVVGAWNQVGVHVGGEEVKVVSVRLEVNIWGWIGWAGPDLGRAGHGWTWLG